MFVDRVKIRVAGGRGGNGCVSFRREKFVPKGGPDGGSGGDGGSVILRASDDEQSLVALYYMPHYEGGRGKNGEGKGKHGARGDDRLVNVPMGTVVYDADSGRQLADLDHDGDEFLAAQGGRGGNGNTTFATATRRTPRFAEPGEDGEERELHLELKIVADVGLVGFPNAGKSTLITTLSDAQPKTAAYPFTTLRPVVGVVQFDDFFRYTVADVPGLIEGAHENVGLGHDFLRHIERARVLVYVLDAAGIDNRNPLEDFNALRHELECHKSGLSSRPGLAVANKIDEPDAVDRLPELREKLPVDVFPVCAVLAEGVEPLKAELRRILEQLGNPA